MVMISVSLKPPTPPWELIPATQSTNSSGLALNASKVQFSSTTVACAHFIELFFFLSFADPSFEPEIQEVNICEHHNATISCDVGEVLRITSADYGRSDGETCSAGVPARQTQNQQCEICVGQKVREWWVHMISLNPNTLYGIIITFVFASASAGVNMSRAALWCQPMRSLATLVKALPSIWSSSMPASLMMKNRRLGTNQNRITRSALQNRTEITKRPLVSIQSASEFQANKDYCSNSYVMTNFFAI